MGAMEVFGESATNDETVETIETMQELGALAGVSVRTCR
jgi:hypothetical protein